MGELGQALNKQKINELEWILQSHKHERNAVDLLKIFIGIKLFDKLYLKVSAVLLLFFYEFSACTTSTLYCVNYWTYKIKLKENQPVSKFAAKTSIKQARKEKRQSKQKKKQQ